MTLVVLPLSGAERQTITGSALVDIIGVPSTRNTPEDLLSACCAHAGDERIEERINPPASKSAKAGFLKTCFAAADR
ncbi:MAG: hypothetical protein LBB65_00590 [Burkholderiales bacterium]|nr:hypothetical protein [Burkholderiales bacterium]